MNPKHLVSTVKHENFNKMNLFHSSILEVPYKRKNCGLVE